MEKNTTYHLGHRAFLLFFSKRIKLLVVVAAAWFLLWYWQDRVPARYADYTSYALELGLLIFVGLLALRLLRTYFEYRGYAYRFDDEFFQVTRGYVVKNEIGIVYHQIQNVNIRQDMVDRFGGVCQVVIIMSGNNDKGRQSDIILPGIDKERARLVQK